MLDAFFIRKILVHFVPIKSINKAHIYVNCHHVMLRTELYSNYFNFSGSFGSLMGFAELQHVQKSQKFFEELN